jgi:hypothetical protein
MEWYLALLVVLSLTGCRHAGFGLGGRQLERLRNR